MRPPTLWAGTSGWSYDWPGFYPPGLAAARRFEHYATEFHTVEINYSFYRLPEFKTVEQWHERAPRGFTFALKVSRLITHRRRLADVGGAWRKFLRRAERLGEHLGPLLVQLPPTLRVEPERLDQLLATADRVRRERGMRPMRIAVEARHASWFENPEVTRVLRRRRAALVIADSSWYARVHDAPATADFVYLRFHGPGALFASQYGPSLLRPWAERIVNWLREGRDVYAYFNNDAHGYAVNDARTLRRLCAGKPLGDEVCIARPATPKAPVAATG